MGVTETLRILLTIFLGTACIQNVRLLGVYDVRWPLLAEIHTTPLKRFVPSSVLQAVRALRNAPAALAVFLAGVAPVGAPITQSTFDMLRRMANPLSLLNWWLHKYDNEDDYALFQV